MWTKTCVAGIHGCVGWTSNLEVRGDKREEREGRGKTVGSRSNRRVWLERAGSELVWDSNLPVQWSGIAGFWDLGLLTVMGCTGYD